MTVYPEASNLGALECTFQSAPADDALTGVNIMREKIEDILVTILCLAIFAGWGVLLALGV